MRMGKSSKAIAWRGSVNCDNMPTTVVGMPRPTNPLIVPASKKAKAATISSVSNDI